MQYLNLNIYLESHHDGHTYASRLFPIGYRHVQVRGTGAETTVSHHEFQCDMLNPMDFQIYSLFQFLESVNIAFENV